MTWQCCHKYGVDDYVLTLHTIVHYSHILYSAGRSLQIIITICIAMTILALFLLLLYFGSPFSYFSHQRSWVFYSPSLPDYVSHFSGREKEINDIVHWLDPQNTAVRIVSIVGPPGFGKSSLAIQVGHEMIDRGVVVNYVNLDELTLEDLPGKIVANAGITTRNGSFERLQKWAQNDISFPVLLILDNCDDVISKQRDMPKNDMLQTFLEKFRQSATMGIIKFLLTAKEKINLVDEFKELPLKEISFEASCKLLCDVSGRKIDEPSCKAVTQLTGHVPLALKVVGAILGTRTRNISEVVEKLENQLLETLNPSDMQQKLNASLTVSFSYLSEWQREVGQYLSLFPGSFAGHDACKILEEPMHSDCHSINLAIGRLEQMSLLQSSGRDRYQFHRIIKEFFSKKSSNRETHHNNTFWKTFRSHYTNLVSSLSLDFSKDYKAAFQTLDTEKHNIHYLLKDINKMCLLDLEVSLKFFEVVGLALRVRFFTCRFSSSELIQPLIAIRNCLEQILDSETVPKSFYTRVMNIMTALAIEQYNLDRSLESLEIVKTLIEKFEGIITIHGAKIIYYHLGTHYHAIGELEKEKRCHEKILLLANATLQNCHYGSCDYHDLSWTYYYLENFKDAAHFAKLDLKYNEVRMSVFRLLQLLYMLHECQETIGNHTEATDTFNMLLYVLPSLNDTSVPEIYSNLNLLSNVASLLHKYRRTDEARQIQKKQILAVKEMNATDTMHGETVALEAAKLVLKFSMEEEYSEVIELAECALNFFKKKNHTYYNIILFILAEAKYHSGQKTASMKLLKEIIEYSFSNRNLYYDATEACNFMISEGRIHVYCLYLWWMDLKQSVYVFVFADTVSADTFSFTSSNDNGKTSTDISLSSDHLEFIQPELAIPVRSLFVTLVEAFFQLIKHLFLSIFNINTVVYCINFVMIILKIIIILLCLCLCFCCCCCICHPIRCIVKLLFLVKACLRRFVNFMEV